MSCFERIGIGASSFEDLLRGEPLRLEHLLESPPFNQLHRQPPPLRAVA